MAPISSLPAKADLAHASFPYSGGLGGPAAFEQRPAMAFQTTNRHRGIAVSVASAATATASETGRALTEQLAPFLRDGETMPDAGLLQDLLGRYLDARGRELIAVDHTYQAEIRGHRVLRAEQALAMANVRQDLRAFRIAVDTILGDGHCQMMLGTRNFTTRDPAALGGLARQAAQALRDPAFFFDTSWPNACGRSSAELARMLETSARELLELHQQALSRQRVRRRIELGNKEESLAATRTAISEGASLLKGLLTFAGNAFLARRLRPSHRKKGG